MDLFEEIASGLAEGKVSMIVIQNAVVESYRRRGNLPIEIRDMVLGTAAMQGIIRKHFLQIQQEIGSLELACRRGQDK